MTGIKTHRFAVEVLDEVMIVRLLDQEIDQGFCVPDDVGAIGEELERLVDSSRPKALLVDFSEVEYIASMMQAMLLHVQKKLRKSGGQLRLCGLGKHVALSFRVTGLERMFAIHPDEQAALEAFDAGR